MMMALERKAFCSLLEHPKTQERIMGMMSTGKPFVVIKLPWSCERHAVVAAEENPHDSKDSSVSSGA
jgi:hypothetical protein